MFRLKYSQCCLNQKIFQVQFWLDPCPMTLKINRLLLKPFHTSWHWERTVSCSTCTGLYYKDQSLVKIGPVMFRVVCTQVCYEMMDGHTVPLLYPLRITLLAEGIISSRSFITESLVFGNIRKFALNIITRRVDFYNNSEL